MKRIRPPYKSPYKHWNLMSHPSHPGVADIVLEITQDDSCTSVDLFVEKGDCFSRVTISFTAGTVEFYL